MFRWLVNLMIATMIFFPEKTLYEKPADYGLVSEDVFIEAGAGTRLHGWFLPAPEARGTVLFFHGNAGNISGRLFKAEGWIKRGFSVFLVDYRSYGRSTGKIHDQKDVLADARASLEWLMREKKVPLSRLVLYGESLGTHPAIRLAVDYPAAALVLEAPFTSFVALGKKHYPFVPGTLIAGFSFPNDEYMDAIKTPVFILHGTRDEICPYEMAGELFEKAPSPKEFFTVTDGAHNDLPVKAGEDYWDKPVEFAVKYLK